MSISHSLLKKEELQTVLGGTGAALTSSIATVGAYLIHTFIAGEFDITSGAKILRWFLSRLGQERSSLFFFCLMNNSLHLAFHFVDGPGCNLALCPTVKI